MNTAKELSDNELTMGSCPKPRSLATCVSSSSPVQLKSTEDLRTWLQEGSLVNHFQQQENNLEPTILAICGPQLSQPSMLFDQNSASLKTLQLSLIADISEPSSETWQKAGIVCDGKFYPQPNWVRRIGEIGYGLLPTPRTLDDKDRSGQDNEIVDGRVVRPSGENYSVSLATMANRNVWPTPTANNYEIADVDALMDRRHRMKEKHGNGNGFGLTLAQAVKVQKWPTPNAADGTGGPGHSGRQGGLNLRTAVRQFSTPTSQMAKHAEPTEWEKDNRQNDLHVTVGGQLNPDWVEWLMNWPVGWTSLEPLTDIDEWLNETQAGEWWQHEHELPRVAQGVENRTHRLKAIGNGQVAACVAMAWRILTEDLF